MATLVLSPRFTPDSQRLRRAALAAGWQVHRAQRFRLDDGALPVGPHAVYGEWLFVEVVSAQLGLRLALPDDAWLAGLPHRWVRRDIVATTLAEARRETRQRFIKPANAKTFRAGLFATGTDLPDHADDATAVLVAEPVQFESEYRLFVEHRTVLASSIYLRDGEVAQVDGPAQASGLCGCDATAALEVVATACGLAS